MQKEYYPTDEYKQRLLISTKTDNSTENRYTDGPAHLGVHILYADTPYERRGEL